MTRAPLYYIPVYYLFHILYAGHPAQILGRLWLAHDEAHSSGSKSKDVQQSPSSSPWKAFDETLKESYRNAGLMASLIATASAALLVLPDAFSHQSTYTLLLASLTCGILSASSAIAFLSAASYDPVLLECMWEDQGLIFVLLLAGPSAWLSHALLCFKMSLLALVWIGGNTSAKIVITTLIGFKMVLQYFLQILHLGLWPTVLGLLGVSDRMNHRLVLPTEDGKKRRGEYRERESQKMLAKKRPGQTTIDGPGHLSDEQKQNAQEYGADFLTAFAIDGTQSHQQFPVR